MQHCNSPAIAIIFLMLAFNASSAEEGDYENCLLDMEKFPSELHRSIPCNIAATQGHADVQYAIGKSFGFGGNRDMEEEYYLRAAANNYPPAYLALGHFELRKFEIDLVAAIHWYEKYVDAKAEDYGYAATLISHLYLHLGDIKQANYWRNICDSSGYQFC